MTSASSQDAPRSAGTAGLARRLLGGALGGLAYWAPVGLAAVFLLQVAWKGLLPALAEERRLEGEAVELRSDHADLVREEAALSRELHAQEDPIYQERLRRALLAVDEVPVPEGDEPPASGPATTPSGGGGSDGNAATAPRPSGPRVR